MLMKMYDEVDLLYENTVALSHREQKPSKWNCYVSL